MRTKKQLAKHTSEQSVSGGIGWDSVINSGLIQLQELEAQAARLRVSIQYFQNRRDSGAAFPGVDHLKSAGLVLEES